MAQKATADGGDEVETYSLEVSKDTVVNGLKINSKPGEKRTVLFRPKAGGGYGEGTLRDVRGMMWDGEAPPQLRPKAFLPDEFAGSADYLETRLGGKRVAEEEGEDPEEGAEVAAEVWEQDVRHALEEEIVVEARFEEETTTVYEIEYVEDDE